MTKPFLSVVIPTYQRNDELAQCLRTLAPGVQNLPSENYEVIVSDDGRAITAEAMIAREYPWARWEQGPALGIGSNRNNGAAHANGRWLVFIDSDTLPDAECLRIYFEAARGRPEAIAFEGAIHGSGKLDTEWYRCPINTHGGLFWTANVAIRKDIFDSIEGFDPALVFYHEDQDIYERLKQIQPIDFLVKAVVVHPARPTTFRHEASRILCRMHDIAYYMKRHGPRLGQPNLVAAMLHLIDFQVRQVWRTARVLHFAEAFSEFLYLVSYPFFFPYFYAKAQPASALRSERSTSVTRFAAS